MEGGQSWYGRSDRYEDERIDHSNQNKKQNKTKPRKLRWVFPTYLSESTHVYQLLTYLPTNLSIHPFSRERERERERVRNSGDIGN